MMWIAPLLLAGCVPDECESGIDVGQCPPDVQLMDQEGSAVSMLEAPGPLLIEMSAMWCQPCQELAVAEKPLYPEWANRLSVHTVLIEDENRESTDPEDAVLWIEGFAVDHPVYIDPDQDTVTAYDPFAGLPALFMMDRRGRVVWTHRGFEGAIDGIEEQLDAL